MAVTAQVQAATDDRNGRPADTALELMKQLITLSSAVLALSATFIQKLSTSVPWKMVVLAAAWLCLISSALAGLETISAIVQARLEPELSDWSTGRGRTSALATKYCFIGGLLLFAVFAVAVLAESGEPNTSGVAVPQPTPIPTL